MTFGEEPDPVVDAFNRSMILYAEHSFNASTFTARVITSTSATCTPPSSARSARSRAAARRRERGRAAHLRRDRRSAERRAWLDDALASKRKIMGFGHRVYKSGDSRVPTMKAALDTAHRRHRPHDLAELYDTLEAEFVARKGIYPNLDYPSGPAYNLIGFDTLTFTPLFIAARITGWTAHIMEQAASNALIRPLSAYDGVDERHIEG
jgi:citrate synthase